MKNVGVGTLTVVVALAACKGEGREAPTAAEMTKGYAVLAPVRSAIQGALTKALARGPVAALEVCSTDARVLTGQGVAPGVVVGRATRKPRNPANLARGWQADALAQFEQDVASGKSLVAARFIRALPGDRLAYAEPLTIQPLCVTCHGTDLAPDVQDALAARYPDDRATGYRIGELRGVMWTELPR